jgi:hypothetical protein
MFAFVIEGITDASTTRSPSSPWTRIVAGRRRELVDAHPARARRVERRLGVARDPVEDLLVRLDLRPGRDLASVEAARTRLPEDRAGAAIASGHSRRVLLGREVVEPERGLQRADRPT